MSAICLCGAMPKYEQYREAWHLLKTPLLPKSTANGATGGSHFSQNQGEAGHPESEPEEVPVGPAAARMQAAMNSFRNYLEKGGRIPR
jgi:hypothetical protein